MKSCCKGRGSKCLNVESVCRVSVGLRPINGRMEREPTFESLLSNWYSRSNWSCSYCTDKFWALSPSELANKRVKNATIKNGRICFRIMFILLHASTSVRLISRLWPSERLSVLPIKSMPLYSLSPFSEGKNYCQLPE